MGNFKIMNSSRIIINKLGIKHGILFFATLLSIFLFYDSAMTTKEKVKQSTKFSMNSNDKLFELLNIENVFLVDIDKLIEIERYKEIQELEIYFNKYFQANSVLSCGCFSQNLESILKKV